jgi:hypothetical protein
METNDIQSLLQDHFGDKPDFDRSGAQEMANAIASAAAVVENQGGGGSAATPTQQQQQCYAQCQKTRDAALAAAGLRGWPLGAAAAAAAIFAYNACRHNCDHNP